MNDQYQLTSFIKKKVDQQQCNLEELDEQCRLKVEKLLNRNQSNLQKQSEKENQFYIDSQSAFTCVWNLVYMVIFYYATFQISVELCLPSSILQKMVSSEYYYLPVYITILVFWCVDIVLSFFKGYYIIGQVRIVSDLRLTALRYVKTQFVIDIIVAVIYTIPLYYQSFQINFLQLIPMVLVWIKKMKYSDEIQKILQYRRLLQTIFILTDLFSSALMISNYAACIFLGMDLYLYNQSYYGQGSSSPYYWLTDNVDYADSLIDGPWWSAYIWAQSFAAGTISTLAPGPFPRNPWQAFYVIIIVIIFIILASYMSDVVVEVFFTYFENRWTHEENIIAFDNFMALKHVPKDVRIRVNNYYEIVWELEMKIQSEEQEKLVERLPKYLREQLMVQMGFTKHLHFLQFIKDQTTLKKMIALKIQTTTIDSYTCIFESDKSKGNQQKKLYYIKQGMAKYYLSGQHCHNQTQLNTYSVKHESRQKLLSLTNVGKLLGIYEFVTGQNYSVCCKSIDLCLLQNLKWSDFWQILSELQIEEQFNQMKHKVLVGRELKHIEKICVVCLEEHIQSECPELFYNKKIQSCIDFSNLKSSQRPRAKKVRKYKSTKRLIKSKYNTSGELLMSQLLKDMILDFVAENKIFKNNISKEIEEVAMFQKYNKKFNIDSY